MHLVVTQLSKKHLPVQSQQWQYYKKFWNMFKANSKDYMFLSCHILHSVSPLPLIYRGMRCLTNHRRENQDFRKNEGAAHISLNS